MIAALLFAAILTARFLPESAFGTWLNRSVMSPLAARLMRIERKHVIFAVAMLLVLTVGSEILAMAGPMDMGLVLVWDASVYVDIVMASLTVAAAARRVGAWRAIKPVFATLTARLRRKPMSRARRSQRSTAKLPPANDDGQAPGIERRAA